MQARWNRWARALPALLVGTTVTNVVMTTSPAAASALFKGATTNSRVGISYLAVPKPASAAPRDVLIAVVSTNQSSLTGVAAPAAWTLECSQAAGGVAPLVMAIYSHVVGPSEPASYTWTFPANSGVVLGLLDYSGLDNTDPVHACAGEPGTMTNLITAPAVLTATANETVVSAFAFRGSGTSTPAPGTSERFDARTAIDSLRSVSASALDSSFTGVGLAPAKVAIASLLAPSSVAGIQLSLRGAPDGTATPTSTTSTTLPSTTTTSTTVPSTTTTTMPPSSGGGGGGGSTNALLTDSFDGADGIITNHTHYQSAGFPSGGTSTAVNPSANWEGDSGSFLQQGGWGYSGRPVDWGNKYFFRFNTRNFSIGNAEIQWQYRSAPFGQDGYPVAGSDAVDVWLRYQTQYNLYVWQFDRTNNCVQAKRKVPAQNWSGPASLVSNKGVYYSLPTDASQPTFGAGQYCVSWNGVQSLLPASERAKPGFPNLAHDGTTVYDFRTVVRNLANGTVQIQAYRAGTLIYSATDDGRIGVAANGETQGVHVDRRYYDTVTGWQPEWALPITKPGASGFRSDNAKFWLDNVTIATLPS